MAKNHRAVRPIDQKTKSAGALDPVEDFNNPLRKEQADLPGMENRAIDELEEAARRYAAIRDKRMALNDAETKLQDLLMGLLKKHGKREYKRDGIEIWIKVEEEKVKVRVKDEDESPSEGRENARHDKESRTADHGNASEAQGGRGASPQGESTSSEAGNPSGTIPQAADEGREPGADDF